MTLRKHNELWRAVHPGEALPHTPEQWMSMGDDEKRARIKALQELAPVSPALQALRDTAKVVREEAARATYERYRAARRALGYESDNNPGMTFEVWSGCDAEAQESMAQQMEQGVREHQERTAAQPKGWGSW